MSATSRMKKLAETVAEAGDVLCVKMSELRDAAGWDRLTKGTFGAIEDGLRQNALWHFPELVINREARVRVYKVGTPAGKLIEAVLNPTDAGDELLREAGGDEAKRLLQDIRQLIGG